MNRKLTVSSFVFAVPLALALASSPAHAAKTVTTTKTVTNTKNGRTVTREKAVAVPSGKTATRQATVARAGKSVTKEATSIGPNGNVIAHSIHDWQPGSLNRPSARTQATPAEIRRERRHMRRVAARERAQEADDRR